MTIKTDFDKSFLNNLHTGKIDATNPDNLSNKVLSEQETRKRLLSHARLVGCEKEMLILFAKADNTMKNCTNEKERKDMGKMFCVSIYNLLGRGGQLFLDGQMVCDDRPVEK